NSLSSDRTVEVMHAPARLVPVRPATLIPFRRKPTCFTPIVPSRLRDVLIGRFQEIVKGCTEHGGNLFGVEAGNQHLFCRRDLLSARPVIPWSCRKICDTRPYS